MKINTKKTKVLRVSKESESDNEDSICRGNYRTSQGILLLRKHDLRSCHREIKRRIATAASIWFEIWGALIRVKRIRFLQANFRKISILQASLQRILSFPCKFPKILIFQAIKKIRISKQKIVHLQLHVPLGKLFYFSSKVTTFEHTSCK